ncbi:MAG TPA: hypothetical protein VIK57_10870 [Streptosporangiaceae bacterium]
MTGDGFEHADRNVPRAGLSVVKCRLHPGSVDMHHPADDEQIMHMSAALWAAFVDWVKAGFGDYERLPDDPRKHLPIFRG